MTLTLEREAKKGPTYKTADTNGTTDAINFSINSGLIIAYWPKYSKGIINKAGNFQINGTVAQNQF